jgi:hypothetical protein
MRHWARVACLAGIADIADSAAHLAERKRYKYLIANKKVYLQGGSQV